MRASPAQVTVITVAANSGEALFRWRDAWTPTGCSLLVADNASSDGCPAASGLALVPTGCNHGFGFGVNAAVKACGTPLVLVTNPDTLPETAGSLESLIGFHREGSLSGATLIDTGGCVTGSGGRWPSVPWVASQVLRRARPLWNGPRVDWVQGALILAERSLFLDRLEGFHSDFPLYFEDVDLCARARALGASSSICTGARFVHREGTGAPTAMAIRIASFHWGMWRWFVRHKPRSASLVRVLISLKCVSRMSVFRRGSPMWTGYSDALSSLRRGEAPTLPEL